MERYLSWKYPLLAVALIAGGVAFRESGRLSYEGNVERFFPDAAEMDAYRHLKSTFGGNEVVLAVYVDEQLFAADGSGIERLRKIRQRIEQVPSVTSVLSLDRALGNWLAQENQGLATRLRTLFEGYTHGSDGKTVALACMLEPHAIETMVSSSPATSGRRATLSQLRDIMQSLPAPMSHGVLTGEPVLVSEGLSMVERDGKRLGRWSMGLLGLTIAVCFRKIRWIVFPLVTVLWSTWVTRAVLAWSGLQLSLVSSMLAAVVTVVGVATVIHIVVQYEHALCLTRSPRLALRTTLERLAAPIAWAIATDAVGFLSLTLSHVTPVRDFGVMMAVGSLMVLIGVFLLAPAMILWRATSDAVPQSQLEIWMVRNLSASIPWIRTWRVPLAWGAVLFFLVTGCGGFFLEVETDFTKNFRDASPIVGAYRVVEEQLGGAGVCDIIVPAPRILTWEYLNQIGRLRQDLERMSTNANFRSGSGLTKILSLDDALRAVMDEPTGRDVEPSVVQAVALQAAIVQLRSMLPEFFHALYAENAQGQAFFRIMLRARERQPAAEKQLLIRDLHRIAHQHFPEARVTGFFVLLAGIIESILSDQWTTFSAAIVGIALVMLCAFRDPRLVLIAMVPNVLPIMSVMGLMGWQQWLGLTTAKMNMGAAMIAAVSLGLSIDASIHYLTDFLRGLKENGDAFKSLQLAQSNVGQALVLSTLSLIVGFTVLCSSDFMPTVYFGVLVSLSMLASLLGNLLLIPLQLTFLYVREPQ